MHRLSRLVLPAFCVAAPLAFLSCQGRVGFDAVSVRPIYGWADGCTPVSIGGHGFGSDVAVTIGGKALEGATLPATDSLDYGYQVTGTTPPAEQAGYAEVVVTTGGESAAVFGDFYYEACPLAAYPESISPSDGVTSGATIQLDGCSLQADYQVKVGTANPVPLTSLCSTASVSFSAPALADGTYYVAIVDSAGAAVFPDAASGCDTTAAVGSGVVTTDTGSYDLCDGVPTLTYGGGA